MKKLHHPIAKILKQSYHERSLYGNYLFDKLVLTESNVVDWLKANIEGINDKVYEESLKIENKMSQAECNKRFDRLIDKLEAEQKERGLA